MNFYLHYLGDYARDTKGLSLLEHGAYRVLLDHVYATEEHLPDDVQALYRIAGAMTPAERKAVDKVAEKFFPVNGDGRRHNKRAEEEISKAKVKSEKARASAERRWGGNAVGDANGMRTHNDGNANQKPEPEESKASDASHRKAATASQPPACPHEKLVEAYHELLPTCPRVVEWTPARRAAMAARWREQAVRKGEGRGYTTVEAGLDFWRRYLGYVAKSDFLTGRAPGRAGAKPFVANLEWLVKPANFAKVVEGNYHS